MNFKERYFKHVLITVFMSIIITACIYSQGTDISGRKLPLFYLGLSAGPYSAKILNVDNMRITGLNTSNKMSYSGDFVAGVLITNNFGLSIGIGYTTYSSLHSLSSYLSNFNTTDTENEAYERRVTGKDITELQNISFINLPVCLNFTLPFKNNKMGVFLQTGVTLLFGGTGNYKSSGNFTYKGYYPSYNVVFENLPAYGFPSNKSNNTEEALLLNSFNISVIASGGLEFFISKKVQLAIGATYNRSVSDISGFSLQEDFQLSDDSDKINSIMAGSTKVGTESAGLKLSLRFYLE